MGEGPGALGDLSPTRGALWVAAALLFFFPMPSGAGTSSSKELSPPQTVEVQAGRMILLENGTIFAEGAVSLRSGIHAITAQRALLSLNTGRLSLDAPKILGSTYGTIFAARADLLSDGSIALAAPVFSLTLKLEAERAQCDNLGCRVENAHVFLCPGCSRDGDLALSARRVTIHPGGDVDLEDPTLLIDEEPAVSLPFLRLRPPHRPALFPPVVGLSPSAGFLFGVGGRLPLGESRTAEGMVIARSQGGFQTQTTVSTPRGEIDLAHLSDLPSGQHDLAAEAGALVNLAEAQLALKLDATTSGAALEELYRRPEERALGTRTSVATLRFPGTLTQLETSARFSTRLDTPQGGGPDPTGALALILSLPARPLLSGLFFLDARLCLWRHFDVPSPRAGAWNNTVTAAQTEAFFPFRLGFLKGNVEVTGTAAASFLDRSSSARPMAASRLSVVLELPLQKKTSGSLRKITPFIRYENYPLLWSGPSASLPAQSPVLPAPARASLGVRGLVLPAQKAGRWDLKISVVAEAAKWSGAPAPSHVHLVLGAAETRFFEGSAQAAFDLRSAKPSLLGARLSFPFDQKTVLELSASYLGAQRGPHTHPDWTDRLPALGVFYPIRLDLRPHAEVAQRLGFAFTQRLSAHLLTRNQVWPRFSFLATGYGIEWRPSCDCISLSFDALHRPDTAVPDAMAFVSWTAK